mmetsp:Transcript_57982/g.118652  ORF Transcript_57982/g.118652 Transcript_57982/m.118652 type:complete len:270 (-) Transcript_57982:192-1001(-)
MRRLLRDWGRVEQVCGTLAFHSSCSRSSLHPDLVENEWFEMLWVEGLALLQRRHLVDLVGDVDRWPTLPSWIAIGEAVSVKLDLFVRNKRDAVGCRIQDLARAVALVIGIAHKDALLALVCILARLALIRFEMLAGVAAKRLDLGQVERLPKPSFERGDALARGKGLENRLNETSIRPGLIPQARRCVRVAHHRRAGDANPIDGVLSSGILVLPVWRRFLVMSAVFVDRFNKGSVNVLTCSVCPQVLGINADEETHSIVVLLQFRFLRE